MLASSGSVRLVGFEEMMTKKKTPKKRPAKKQASSKGSLRVRAFGEAADDFGKEIAPLGAPAGVLARRVGNLLLGMLNGAVYGLEHVSNWLHKAVTKRLEKVDSDKVVPPNPRIAVPAVQALIYSMNDELIRDMFANLVAASMNKDKQHHAHPAFVEMIKEMTPADAKVFIEIARRPQIAYRILYAGHDHRQNVATLYSFEPSDLDLPAVTTSISNLSRLGIITINPDEFPVIPGINDAAGKDRHEIEYEARFGAELSRLKEDPERLNELGLGPNVEILVLQSGVFLSPLGEHFAASCISE